jgi:hypothetical protein
MSLWMCQQHGLHGPCPGNICPTCGEPMSWASVSGSQQFAVTHSCSACATKDAELQTLRENNANGWMTVEMLRKTIRKVIRATSDDTHLAAEFMQWAEAKDAELSTAKAELRGSRVLRMEWQDRAEAAESQLSTLTASLTALVEQEKLMGDPRWLGKQVTALLRKISQ